MHGALTQVASADPPPTWNLYDGGTSVEIGYASGGSSSPPSINLSFGNSSTYNEFTMDTGSVGILASRHYFDSTNARRLGPGVQIYSSSGRYEYGTWYATTQNIYDSAGNLVARAEVPVLKVDKEIVCPPGGSSCTENHDPDVHMMGVGFARELPTDAQPYTHGPNYNPFLNLTEVRVGSEIVALPADWHAGYVVSNDHVVLGLTAVNTAGAGFVKLVPNPAYYTPTNQEWSPTPTTLTLKKGADTPITLPTGTLLVDTGLMTGQLNSTTSLAALAHTCDGGTQQCLDHDVRVDVTVPGQSNPVFSYNFVADKPGTGMAPKDGVVLPGLPEVSFNTSLSALEGIKLIFDAENGFVGYQFVAAPASVSTMVALVGAFQMPDGFVSSMGGFLFGPTALSSLGSSQFTDGISGLGRHAPR